MNGQWGQWTAWTACDKASCGHQSRERQCDSPAPGFKGDPCDGEATETQWCNTDPCEGIQNQLFYILCYGSIVIVRHITKTITKINIYLKVFLIFFNCFLNIHYGQFDTNVLCMNSYILHMNSYLLKN